jgi:tRNA(Ile)-lysidine synthase
VTRRAAPAGGASAAQGGFSSVALARRLLQLVGPLRGVSFCVAYSGGADSTALLAAAAALRGRHRLRLRAVHVNHRMQASARAMALAARATARRLAVPCRVIDAPVSVARGDSPEAAARAARYSALHAVLRPGEWLLLAQHQDDQVEALLLQLLRGAGVAGLAAMPGRAGCRLRPLLEFSRAQLQGYLRRRRLVWVEDPSNADERMARNFLRLRVLPLLRARWPGLGAAIGRSATLAAEARGLLAQRAEALLREARVGPALSVSVLRRLGAAERRNALRYWLEQLQLPMPDQARLLEIAGPVLRARADAQPCVRWRGALVRRHGDLLHAGPDAPAAAEARRQPEHQRLRWDWLRHARLALPGGGELELRRDPRGALARSALPSPVTVDFRSGDGAVAARVGGRRLKRLLRAAARKPWQRGRVPLVFHGERLLAVADSWQAPELAAGAAAGRAGRARLCWRRTAIGQSGPGSAFI